LERALCLRQRKRSGTRVLIVLPASLTPRVSEVHTLVVLASPTVGLAGRIIAAAGNYYGGGYYDNGWDWGGLAAGMILGGALAAQSSYADSVGYCMRRFKSYDPRIGTYLGYDGYRHPCP
jgi:hypothetical protein